MNRPSEIGELLPRPDPTARTVEQLLREIASLKELFGTRLDAMDKAIVLLQDAANRSPTVNEVFLQHQEMFNSVRQRFEERDIRFAQAAHDSRAAVDSTITAAKSIAEQQNNNFTKQIDQQGTLIHNIAQSLDSKITDVKDRVTLIEGRTNGVTITERRGFDLWGVLIGGLGMLISLITFVLFVTKIK